MSVSCKHPLLCLFCRVSYFSSVGVVLAFTIPRVPDLQFNNDKPLTTASGAFNSSIPTAFSRAPANFSFPAYASLQMDTNANFLPLTFTSIKAQVYDTDTNMEIATGDVAHQTFPAKTYSNFNMPLNFTYVATNDTDQTCRLSYIYELAHCLNSGCRGELV